ncbi:hypothetical protein D3C73_517550 [compost metagenome]
MQIHDRIIGCFHDLPDPDRQIPVIRLRIEQHAGRGAEKPEGPARYDNAANNAHDRIKRIPAIEPTEDKCGDCQYRGQRIS